MLIYFRTILIFSLLLACYHLSAQWYTEVGASASTLVKKPPVPTDRPFIGWDFALGIRLPLSKDSSLATRPGFRLAAFGYRTNTGNATSQYLLHSFDLPFVLDYRMTPKLWLEAGFQWKLIFSAYANIPFAQVERKLRLNKPSLLAISGGLDYRILPWLSLVGHYEYDLTLLDKEIVVNPDGTFGKEYPVRIHSLKLGCRIYLIN